MTLVGEMQFSLWIARRKICKDLVTILPGVHRWGTSHAPWMFSMHSWSSIAVCTSEPLCHLGKTAQWLFMYLCIIHVNKHIRAFLACPQRPVSNGCARDWLNVHGYRQEDTGNPPECGACGLPGSCGDSNPRSVCQTPGNNHWLPPILPGASS